MEINKINAFSALLIALSVTGYVGVYSYTSINKNKNVQCLADSLKGVSSDVAVRELMDLCETHGDNGEPFVGTALTEDEWKRVTGKADVANPMFSPTLNGRLYNGNNSIAVKTVIVRVDFKKNDKIENSSHYLIKKEIKPLSTTDFSIPIITYDGDFSWSIDSAIGDKIKVNIL